MPSDSADNGSNGDYSTYKVSDVSKSNFTHIFKFNALHNQINGLLDSYMTEGYIYRPGFGSFGQDSKPRYEAAFDADGSKVESFSPELCAKKNEEVRPMFRKIIDRLAVESGINPKAMCGRPMRKVEVPNTKKEDWSFIDNIPTVVDHPVTPTEELWKLDDFRYSSTLGATLTCITEEELFLSIATALSTFKGITKLSNYLISPKWSGARYIDMIVMVSGVPCNFQIHFAPLTICSATISEVSDYFGSMFEDMKAVDVKKKLIAFERMGEMPKEKDVQETLRMILAGTDKQKMDAIVQITGG
ncbi:hypothetical protein TrST_g12734 [Triparma strigata]|uniref:Uncharacterized protein n=1 Tax=Triparma strigata TaxID=1606541 RepID=A0A9W7ATN2_9STRA|nr:hypothetical protein TrST_g12734 [Triparma strigata]